MKPQGISMCFLHLQKATSPFFRLHQLRDESKQLLWLSWSSPILGSHKSHGSRPKPMETLTRCRFVKGWSTPRSGPSPSNLVYKSLTHTLSKLKKYHYTISQPPKDSKIPKIVWNGFKTFSEIFEIPKNYRTVWDFIHSSYSTACSKRSLNPTPSHLCAVLSTSCTSAP